MSDISIPQPGSEVTTEALRPAPTSPTFLQWGSSAKATGTVEETQADDAEDKAFTRFCNFLAGQLSMKLAQTDTTRASVANAAGVPEDVLKKVQSGEAGCITLNELFKIEKALEGSVTPMVQFGASSNQARPEG